MTKTRWLFLAGLAIVSSTVHHEYLNAPLMGELKNSHLPNESKLLRRPSYDLTGCFDTPGGEAIQKPLNGLTVRSTGTTIVGVICGSTVILGADSRATSGEIVADKRCAKIHRLAPNIFCCGAGTGNQPERSTIYC